MILLPDEGSLDDWIMCQPSGTVLYSCQQMPNLLGKNVVVMGQGSIGLSFTMITSRIGARNVITVDLLDYRLEASKTFGSTHQLNPERDNLEEAVSEITGGVGADVVVEAAGYADTFNMCFRLVRQNGTCIIFGIQEEEFIPLEHNWLMDKQPRIIPTTGGPQRRSHQPHTGNRGPAAARLVRSRPRWSPTSMGFSDVQRAYDMYDQRQDNIIKVVMDLSN